MQTPDFQNFTINTSGDALALENMKANSKFTFQHAVPDSDDSLIYLVGQWDESIALMRIKRTGEIVYWD